MPRSRNWNPATAVDLAEGGFDEDRRRACCEKTNSNDKRVDCRAVEHERTESGEQVLQ